MKTFLRISILSLVVLSLTSLSSSQTLIWGIPEKVCIAYGGKYDRSSGLSEWSAAKLVLRDKLEHNISGTLTLGNKELQFDSQTVDADGGRSNIKSLLFRSKDNSFSLAISRIDADQLEIKSRSFATTATHIYDTSQKEGSKLKLTQGRSDSFGLIVEKSDVIFLLPLLSYKLGGEMGFSGNNYPAAFPIHRSALTVAEDKDIRLLTISGNRLVPLGPSYIEPGKQSSTGLEISFNILGSAQTNCTGRMPGSSTQECFGMCGPKCTCWSWACGDCCCHRGCRDHDATCTCSDIKCWLTAIAAPFDCAPCNNPGNLPSCVPPPSGGSSGSTGSQCPSGQFYCSHSGGCRVNGSQCIPTCEIGKQYCERLGRCARKTECIPQPCTSTSCGPGAACVNGKCYLT